MEQFDILGNSVRALGRLAKYVIICVVLDGVSSTISLYDLPDNLTGTAGIEKERAIFSHLVHIQIL